MLEPDAPPLAREHMDRDAVSRTAPDREAGFDADPNARVLVVRDGVPTRWLADGN